METSSTDSEWRRFVREHTPKFLLFARQKSRSEADAQDLVQESMVEASERQGTGAPPSVPLVFATIQRRAIDLARREQRRQSREQAATEPVEAWFDTGVEDRETAAWLQQALRQLPGEQSEVITLKIWGGLTFAEIGEALGLPANTAASRYRYGMMELRKLTKGVLT
jgi:RNA polymerase sigma-70 factor (ECF subfamily)